MLKTRALLTIILLSAMIMPLSACGAHTLNNAAALPLRIIMPHGVGA